MNEHNIRGSGGSRAASCNYRMAAQHSASDRSSYPRDIFTGVGGLMSSDIYSSSTIGSPMHQHQRKLAIPPEHIHIQGRTLQKWMIFLLDNPAQVFNAPQTIQDYFNGYIRRSLDALARPDDQVPEELLEAWQRAGDGMGPELLEALAEKGAEQALSREDGRVDRGSRANTDAEGNEGEGQACWIAS